METQMISHGALQAFFAVLLGAFGAHGLHFDDYGAKIWQTAVLYHLVHALALVQVGILGGQRKLVHWCFG